VAEDSINIMQAIGSFALVIGLLLGFSYVLKRFGAGGAWMEKLKKDGRIKVVDVCMIDPQHKCVILKRDAVEHVVLLSPQSATVLETLVGEKPRA
jgi:flagellar biogenesis protein FliO